MKNRIIKFRAWDKLNKKMSLNPTFTYEEGEIDNCYFEDNEDYAIEELIIMQSTGLYDSTKWEDLPQFEQQLFRISLGTEFGDVAKKEWKGKKIYEGDIFNCIYKGDGCNHKLSVVWDEESACFRIKSYGECDQPNVIQTMLDIQRKEVIGNVCENPELLTKNNGRVK